jgi:phosphoenolpyruvate synthase/pyruvate phosphate dikinase
MTEYLWDGPDDSDEEIEELAKYKCDYEKKAGIKFSKNGIIKFVTEQLSKESRSNKSDPKISKAWEEKLKIPGLVMFLKKGGTTECPD